MVMCTKYCQLRKAFSWLTAPFAVLILSFNTAVAQNLADFSHGRHNICTINTDGNLECTTFDDPVIYLPPDDGTLYTDVSSGSDHSCAITQAGELRCWGLNNLGVSCGIQESGDTVCWTTTERISNTIPDNPNYWHTKNAGLTVR